MPHKCSAAYNYVMHADTASIGPVGWDGLGSPLQSHWELGQDGQLGPSPVGGTVWDVPGNFIASQWNTATG